MSEIIGIGLGILAMICWGVSDFFAALAVRKHNVFVVYAWQAMISSLFLLLLSPFIVGSFSLTWPLFFSIFMISVLAISSGYSTYRGLQVGHVSVISPLANSWPIVTVIASIIFLREQLNLYQGIAITIMIIGGLLISFKKEELTNKQRLVKGVGWAIIAIFASGIFFIFLDIASTGLGWFLPILLYKFIILFFIFPIVIKKRKEFVFNHYFLFIGVALFECLALLTYGRALSYTFTSLLASFGAFIPLTTAILAGIILKERLDRNQYLGVILILVGIAVISL